jgi:peptide/nickel transport system permease protein
MSGAAAPAPLRRRAAPISAATWLALAVLALLLLCALAAPWIAPFDPDRTQLLRRLRPPAGYEAAHPQHWFGTDQLGRDLLSRCLHGLRVSLGIALIGSVMGCLIGSSIGLVAGYLRGRVETVLMMLVDAQIALPYLLLVLVGLAVFGTSTWVLVALVSLAGWETYARLARGQVLSLRERPFVEASRALGAGPFWILGGHILPHLMAPLAVQFTLGLPGVMLLESSLSFLGIGVQPPTATLGRMIGEGRHQMLTAPWVVIAPTAVILLVTLSVQAIGDWLRDRSDPRGR